MARNSSNVGKHAEMILDEMEQSEDKLVRPNAVAYSLAVRACYHSGERGRAKHMLERMEASKDEALRPTTRLYNSILHHFAQMGSSLAAQRVEAIVSHMQDMSTNGNNRRLKPDVYSYNILLAAWLRAHDDSTTNVGERVWKILQQMKVNGVVPDILTYNHSITLLSKSHRRRDVYRAETMLQTLLALSASSSKDNPQELQPNIRHFFHVARGWLRLGHLQDAARVMMLKANSSINRSGEKMETSDNTAFTPTNPRDLFKNYDYDFDTAVQHWIQKGDLPQATGLMEQHLLLYRRGRLSAGPRRHTCEQLLAAWERGQEPFLNGNDGNLLHSFSPKIHTQLKEWIQETEENVQKTSEQRTTT